MAVSEQIVTKLTPVQNVFLKNSYTKFYDNPTCGLVTDSRSQLGGRTDMVSK
jgi:hypothetical protein